MSLNYLSTKAGIVQAMLVQAAHTVARSKDNYLSAQFRRTIVSQSAGSSERRQ